MYHSLIRIREQSQEVYQKRSFCFITRVTFLWGKKTRTVFLPISAFARRTSSNPKKYLKNR
jgi:hypothetical protein